MRSRPAIRALPAVPWPLHSWTRGLPRPAVLVRTRTGTAALVGILVCVSLALRTLVLDAAFWIDEGLSVGIASHAVDEIPGLLRQDGSPPLYYVLLHGWMRLFGDGEATTHALSLLFALLAVPAAFWAGSSVFGRRAGWTCAGLAAVNPFLTAYAQETRMYSLVVLLSVLATASFVHAFVFGRRRYLPAVAALLALLAYTHNWGIFFGAGAAAALVPCVLLSGRPRALGRDALLAFGGAAVLFAPWIPTLLVQADETGAPWSNVPGFWALTRGLATVLGGDGQAVAALLGAGAGLLAILRPGGGAGGAISRPADPRRAAILSVLVLGVATLVLAWAASQISPAWAARYLAIVLGPVLLLAAAGLARAGGLGIAALAVVIALSAVPYTPAADHKSNVRQVVAQVQGRLGPGDLVISTHPEQVPVLHYYLRGDVRYATTLGLVPDPTVMDWRHAVDRLEGASVPSTLAPLLGGLPTGGRVLLVRPVASTHSAWRAPWTRLVRRRSREWTRALESDRRFVGARLIPASPGSAEPRIKVRGTIYSKITD